MLSVFVLFSLYIFFYRAFITALDNDNSVRIFRLVKKDDGSHNHSITAAVTFPKVRINST